MRYSKEHKAETHRRIVAKAAVRLREKGVHGVGVADLMKDAGLTHGGFYAHFDSREALVIEAFSRTMDASIRGWRKAAESAPPPGRFATLVENYLSPQHRDAPGQGCAVAALGSDIARESPKARRAFAVKIEEMVDAIAELLPDAAPDAAAQQAMAALSTMTGALMLARIAGNGAMSDDILRAGRESVLGCRPVQRGKRVSEARPKRIRSAKSAKLPAAR